jgi:hypothetical protein
VVCPVQLGLRMAESCDAVGHVRVVVSRDGGPGRWWWWSAGRSGVARRPRTLVLLRALTLCRVDDKVALDADRRRHFGAAPRRVGFFIYVRASRVCSSHSSHDVFSPALVKGRLVFDRVVFRDGSCLFRS